MLLLHRMSPLRSEPAKRPDACAMAVTVRLPKDGGQMASRGILAAELVLSLMVLQSLTIQIATDVCRSFSADQYFVTMLLQV